jgi:hypothetical protein
MGACGRRKFFPQPRGGILSVYSAFQGVARPILLKIDFVKEKE